jgi:hypothetical protein
MAGPAIHMAKVPQGLVECEHRLPYYKDSTPAAHQIATHSPAIDILAWVLGKPQELSLW